MIKLKNKEQSNEVNIPNEIIIGLLKQAGIDANTKFIETDGDIKYIDKDGKTVQIKKDNSYELSYCIPDTPHGGLNVHCTNESTYNTLLIEAGNELIIIVEDAECSYETPSPSSYGLVAYIYSDIDNEDFTTKHYFG